MKIYWNTDARQITFDIESGMSAPRYSKLPLELFFLKGEYPNNLDPYLLPEETVIHAVLKPEGAYNTTTALSVIIGSGFATPAIAENPYTADLSLNTVNIESLFRQLGNTEQVKCTMVLLYRPANVGDWVVSPQIAFTLENAVATGYEGAPEPVPQGVAWGEINGDIEDQTDLINELNERPLKTTVNQYVNITAACSDEASAITAGSGKVTFRSPSLMVLTGLRASLGVASTSGVVTVDVLVGGVSILLTKLTIDANEKTSVTAAIPVVISNPNISDDAEISINVDTAGTGAKGLKVTFFV